MMDVEAIKRVRSALGLGLREASNAVLKYGSADAAIDALKRPTDRDNFEAQRRAVGLNAARYLWLRERLLGADFDYQGECVILFRWPVSAAIGADLDASIDEAARAEERSQQ